MAIPGPQISAPEKKTEHKVPYILGFGLDGVYLSRCNTPVASPPLKILNNMAFTVGGWQPGVHPRLLGDTTGDGHKDLVGFGHHGVWTARNSGRDTFETEQLVLRDFGYSAGWRPDRHIRLLSDLRRSGRVDIVGFGIAGVLVSLNVGNGQYGPVTVAVKNFGETQGWTVDKHPRYVADLTGDGYPDIIGFGHRHTYISRSKGDGTFHDPQIAKNLDGFAYDAGWRVDLHPRLLADLTGDGKPDIIGFKNDGVFVFFNDGQGQFGPITFVVHDFGHSQGWRTDKHPRFVVPLTNKKSADIIGFGNAGVFVAVNNGDGTFQRPKLVLQHFGVHQGWDIQRHPRFLVDLTGNGCLDIVGFGEAAVFVSYNNGHGLFGSVQRMSGEYTAIKGWTDAKTVRYVTSL